MPYIPGPIADMWNGSMSAATRVGGGASRGALEVNEVS
jgi:hypothetical protein